MTVVGVLFDYFAAASDEEAAGVIDRLGGPGSQAVSVTPRPTPKRGLFRKKPPAPVPVIDTDPELPVYDTISVKGIDPIVQLGTLEALLTGRPYDDVVEDPRSGHDLASRDGGERLVITITDSLTAALAGATDEALQQVAVPWSQTEEFWGAADPSDLAGFLVDLGELARGAADRGHRLYCWICV